MNTLRASVRHTLDQLTASGAPFECVDIDVQGQRQRAYRHAFPTLQALLQAARGHGQKAFIVSDGVTWTFEAVFACADALAARWQHEQGLHAGDRVAIAMRNRAEWVIGWVAAVLCGAVPAPLNSFGQRDELAAALSELRPRILLCDEERFARVEGLADVVSLYTLVVGGPAWLQAVSQPAPRRREVAVSPDDAALILYTSGASSRAKGVLSTHRAVCQGLFNIDFIGAFSAATSPQALQRLMARGLAPTTLTAVPLFHVSGLHAQLMSALRHGRRLVFMRRWDPAAAVDLIRSHQVTQFNGAPAMVMQLVAQPGFDELAATTLGGLGFGGAGLPQRLIDDVLQRMPDSMSGIGFGMTESNGVGAAVSGALFAQRPQAAGVPSPIIDIRIEGLAGEALAPGAQGEICLRGISLMQAYWAQPEATAQAVREGWLHTGDIGYLDDDGLLHVVDRIKDVINRHGEKIAAVEVESCLLMHPDVQEVAVFGVPDATTGEAVAAQVVLRAGSLANEAALAHHVAGRLAAYKVPAQWHLGNEPLPRNPAGKLLKRQLRDAWLSLTGVSR
ncbi:MAG: acyl--CoA ligase [Rubrivivax sp.]|nr:acyl--CoA ligase [Rubrivivax sp.]